MMYKTGIIFGSWDLLHAGHQLMIGEADELCEELIVCLHTDPTIDRKSKNRPVETVFERYLRLNSFESINYIVPYSHESDIELILRAFKPDVRFMGSDYRDRDFTGRDYCQQNGIQILFLDREHGLSTSELRERIKNG